MIDVDFLLYALDEKRHQMKTASPSELAALSAEKNQLLRIITEEIERGKSCLKPEKQAAVTDAKQLSRSLAEAVLLALKIPLKECRGQWFK